MAAIITGQDSNNVNAGKGSSEVGITQKVSDYLNNAADSVKENLSGSAVNGTAGHKTGHKTGHKINYLGNNSSTHIYNATDPIEDESHQRISSYFLGPKAENFDWFQKNLIEILEAQRDARLDYFPRDGKFITEGVQMSTAFRQSSRKITRATQQAARLLGKHSIPFWSPRYQGHMCMDLSMPALLGYFMTMLYNPNNVSIEASPITTVAEIQVGEDLCKMFGYNIDPEDKSLPLSWGHITCDGTVANLESMWVARNLKFYPLSIRSAMKPGGPLNFIENKFRIKNCKGEDKLFSELDTWELLNLKSGDVLDIPEQLYLQYYISPGFLESVMKEYGIQSTSKEALEQEFKVGDMKYFLANTRHYSWPKSGAILGLGSSNIVGVQVDHGARVDMADLRRKLQFCADQHIGVYAVVAIMGSTEEGAVDPLSDIIKIRKEFQQQGLNFLVHGDGAWGGYFCTMLPQTYKPGDEISLPSEQGSAEGFVPDSGLRTKTSEDLFMLREADSVTVDPHKAAYIPYPAGGLCYRDGRMRYQVTWTSPYISRGETTATSIGVFGVEGSKPGASVMSTWFSNACIGLGPEGYGSLLGEVTFTCSRLSAEWAAMSTKEDPFIVVPLNELPCELQEGCDDDKLEAERDRIRTQILEKTNVQIVEEDKDRPEDQKAMKLLRDLGSDLNINAFSCNWRYENGDINDEVEEANYFNQLVIQDLSVDSPEDEPDKIPFYLTSTTFLKHEYEDCAQHFKKRLKLYEDELDLVVMRNVVMSPWPTDGLFINKLIAEFRKVLNKHVLTCRKRNDTSPTKHEFLLHGMDKVFAVHFPMFHLEKHRSQFIMEVKLPEAAMTKYLEYKQTESPEDPPFVLKTTEDLSILDLVKGEKTSFRADVGRRVMKKSNPKEGEDPWQRNTISADVEISITKILKYKSLKGRYRDLSYPQGMMPFYLYGTPQSLCIDHVLVRSPNIVLSADNVQLDFSVPQEALDKGCILAIQDFSEAALQPFQSTGGSLGDTLSQKSDFFFTTNATLNVTVWEDPNEWNQPGPGLVDVGIDKGFGGPPAFVATGDLKAVSTITTDNSTPFSAPQTQVTDERNWTQLGTGKLTIGKNRYIDNVDINKDPFYVAEGTEKYKAWKKVFDSIGKELE